MSENLSQAVDNISFDFPSELKSFFEDTFFTEKHNHEFLSLCN